MGKRAAASCHAPEVSQRLRRRRKNTSDDAAPAPSLRSCSATSQDERRPRQRKNPSTAPARGLRSTATAAAAQARLRRAVSVSWGANKLWSTVRSGPALGSRWRDWAGLDEGPAGLIAERVLANDVADYVRFRAACLTWRRCCADPRARGVLEDPRLFPRQWILLRDNYEQRATAAAPHGIRRRFLNTSTGQCVQVDVPELRDHGVLRATADGLLVLHCETNKAVRLLNPLTRQTAELPPTTGECTPRCAGLVDHGTVYLYLYSGDDDDDGTMAIARPGDDRWARLYVGLIGSTVFFAGRLYGVTDDGILVTVDMAGGGGPRLVVVAERPKQFTLSSTVHLVDNGDGDLRLVSCTARLAQVSGVYKYKRMYTVYRVDFDTGKTTTRDHGNLGGRAIFVDLYRGLSVSPRVFPFLRADTIYWACIAQIQTLNPRVTVADRGAD